MIIHKSLIPVFLLSAMMWGCTYSVIQTDTHGSASDVVDEEQTSNPNVAPVVSIPMPAM